MFNMESRHLLNLSVQNALDFIPENFKLKLFPEEHAPETPRKVRRSQSCWALSPILPLYTISQGSVYRKILRPPLMFHFVCKLKCIKSVVFVQPFKHSLIRDELFIAL